GSSLLVQSLRIQLLEILAVDIDILVAAPGEVHDEILAFGIRRALDGFGDGVRTLERRDNALDAREAARRVERFAVATGDVLGAAAIAQIRVLGPDHGIVEAGGDGMGKSDLAVFVLQPVTVGALQHARSAAAIARRMLTERIAAAAGFHA